jgi:methanogenic corrinoid protein MtbC1
LSSLRNSSTPIKPVLIGGAAFQRDPNLAKRVGADGSATNETEAVAVANSLTSSSARQPIA